MSGRRIGNYLITDYIGSGGFGSVFKAEDVTTPGRVVAIKELHKKHTRNTVIKQRFFQEALAMARLDHPNLPRIYTFGEENGCYYLVMEFISGEVLSDELHAGGRMSPARAVAIITQLLEALSYAHRNGIIHRDLKPDNIILIADGWLKIKVLDFGIARIVGGENLTLTGEGFGTPAYMSPERLGGGASDDPRIDIYSAGIILYEMLAGETPFRSQASDPVVYWTEMRTLHNNEPLPSLASLDAPQELERVLARATAKRVEDRYSSSDEMLADLRSISGLVDRAQNAGTENAETMIGAAPSRIALTTTPGAADVYVDDMLRGSSEAARGKLLVEGLTPGLHNVRVTKSGYIDYRISVSLEAGAQTDLQVSLSARATVAMPPIENTAAAAAFNTIKFQGGNEAQTALIVVESLPAGSTLFVGAEAVTQADEDGRATVRLNPGSHEIKVTAPTGATAKSFVTVSNEDTGSLKTITLPLNQTATARNASSAGRRLAAVAVVALLLALAAAAYFALRGPARGNAQAESASTSTDAQQAAATPPVPQDAASIKPVELKPLTDADKSKLEKKLAEAEKKLKEEKKAAASEPTLPTPQTIPPPQPAPAQDACLNVRVIVGHPARFKVVAIALPEASGKVLSGMTNGLGMWASCGLRAGNRVRVMAFGMKGVLRGTREITLSPGQNTIEIQASEQPNVESVSGPATPFTPGRKRPRFRRP